MHCFEDLRKYFFEIILTEMFLKIQTFEISCYRVRICYIASLYCTYVHLVFIMTLATITLNIDYIAGNSL